MLENAFQSLIFKISQGSMLPETPPPPPPPETRASGSRVPSFPTNFTFRTLLPKKLVKTMSGSTTNCISEGLCLHL